LRERAVRHGSRFGGNINGDGREAVPRGTTGLGLSIIGGLSKQHRSGCSCGFFYRRR